MSLVFMDSVGLLALWSESDQWHEAAEKAFVEITRKKDALLTTTIACRSFSDSFSCSTL
jgi:predicted nucleic acid-binding protein